MCEWIAVETVCGIRIFPAGRAFIGFSANVTHDFCKRLVGLLLDRIVEMLRDFVRDIILYAPEWCDNCMCPPVDKGLGKATNSHQRRLRPTNLTCIQKY